jgi:hypothetical protein
MAAQWNITDFSCGFHLFELHWYRKRMRWLLDGVVFHEEAPPPPASTAEHTIGI